MGIRHALIVDDERLARRELRTLLDEAHASQVRVVGEAASVEEAARIARGRDADVVFLDVHLGSESGLELLPLLEPDVDVVFVTAYDRYAVRAFELNALDYLLKPVTPERLAATVARLEARAPAAEEDRGGPLEPDDRLFLRMDDRRGFLRVGDIAAVQAERDTSILHLAGGRVVRVRKPLREWVERLHERTFAQIHRSTLVNLGCVERVEEWSHGSHLVYLRGIREPFTMSRRFSARVRALFR
jgi:two-component system LytT family response regulator